MFWFGYDILLNEIGNVIQENAKITILILLTMDWITLGGNTICSNANTLHLVLITNCNFNTLKNGSYFNVEVAILKIA